MHGRVYDPKLGRFLSPDPFVQAPHTVGGFNRYTYCFNNPLRYTDPSGYVAAKYDVYHGFEGAWASVQFYQDSGPNWGCGSPYTQQGIWSKMGAIGDSNPGGSFEDYYTVLTDSEGKERYVHNSNFVSVSRQDVIGFLEAGWVISFAGVVYDEPIIAFINPNNRKGIGWDAVLVGSNDYSVFCYSKSGKNAANGGSMNPYAGNLLGFLGETFFSKQLHSWMGKDFKMRSQNWGGNGRTGGKLKFAKKIAKPFKVGGGILGAYGIYNSGQLYMQGEIGGAEAIGDTIFGAAGIFGGYYGGWANMWYQLGKDYGPSSWFSDEPEVSIFIDYLKTNGMLE